MREWLVAVKCNVLVCVGGFPVNVKAEGAIIVSNDGDVEHGDFAVLLDFPRPFDVRMDGI